MTATITLKEPWEILSEGTINPGATLQGDIIDLTTFLSQRYLIRLKSVAQGRDLQFELAAYEDSGKIFESVFGKVGNSLNVAVNFSIASPNAVLDLTNNESFAVGYTILKVID